jgi:hypothetical protein
MIALCGSGAGLAGRRQHQARAGLLPHPQGRPHRRRGADRRSRGAGGEALRQVRGLWPEKFAGHSLRAGALTSGASAFKLMEVSRHKSMNTLRGYIRRTELFKDHAGADFL